MVTHNISFHLQESSLNPGDYPLEEIAPQLRSQLQFLTTTGRQCTKVLTLDSEDWQKLIFATHPNAVQSGCLENNPDRKKLGAWLTSFRKTAYQCLIILRMNPIIWQHFHRI